MSLPNMLPDFDIKYLTFAQILVRTKQTNTKKPWYVWGNIHGGSHKSFAYMSLFIVSLQHAMIITM